jgi:hypothetical protein
MFRHIATATWLGVLSPHDPIAAQRGWSHPTGPKLHSTHVNCGESGQENYRLIENSGWKCSPPLHQILWIRNLTKIYQRKSGAAWSRGLASKAQRNRKVRTGLGIDDLVPEPVPSATTEAFFAEFEPAHFPRQVSTKYHENAHENNKCGLLQVAFNRNPRNSDCHSLVETICNCGATVAESWLSR